MNQHDSHSIRSERLDLVLLSPEALQLSVAGDTEALERTLGVSVPPEWHKARGLCHLRLEQVTKDPGYLPWGLRAMVLRDQRLMVGYINCHSKPGAAYLKPYSDHAVEFGYTVFPQFRRQGYAREACQALMRWAYEEHQVPEFILSIAPDNLASRRLAEGLGFVQAGTSVDDVDGREDIFKLRYPAD